MPGGGRADGSAHETQPYGQDGQPLGNGACTEAPIPEDFSPATIKYAAVIDPCSYGASGRLLHSLQELCPEVQSMAQSEWEAINLTLLQIF